MDQLYRIDEIKDNLNRAGFRPLDILVIGGTGTGKSSTINALFNTEVAKVGRGCDPETMEIQSMELNDWIRFWDSPGLGDNIGKDKKYAKDLIDLLYEDYHMDGNQYGLIDLVLVILDGSGRDMGTTYKLLNEVIAPNIEADRILVAINQADMAMKGRHWNEVWNRPDAVLLDFLKEKSYSIQDRLMEATGIEIVKPVFYSAERGYNVEKMLDMLIDHMPVERRSFR